MKESKTGASALSDREVLAIQNEWIKNGGTGCVFSQALVVRNEKGLVRWNSNVSRLTGNELRSGHGGEDLIASVESSISNGDELFSTVFPNIDTSSDLAELVAFLSRRPPFHVDEIARGPLHSGGDDDYTGVYLRLALQEDRQSWPLILGPYPFFSDSRRAPFTQLILRPVAIKGNPTTPDQQIGIDDTVMNIPRSTFGLMYRKTLSDVAETRGDYNREMFRARVAVVVPTSDWNRATSSGN
jgi:hypothetical protein